MATAADTGNRGPGPAEWACYLTGALLVALALGALARGEAHVTRGLAALPDMQQWSAGARGRYLAAIEAAPEPVLGALRIPSLDLELPVYAKASTLNLDRGAAIIEGMAFPHELGHIGIAGHRDGYFRALKDLEVGDRLVLETLHGTRTFAVDDLRVVEPSDLAYLGETEEPRLTLVTCHPFYFVGSAPQRYLVRATPVAAAQNTFPQPPGDTR